MNKKRVNDWIVPAKTAIEKFGISKDGKVEKSFRGQISSFGAAVTMGSLRAAVAFFSEQGQAEVDRSKLIVAIYYIISNGKTLSPIQIFEYICAQNDDAKTKEEFIDASIALKLAMNLFELVTTKKGSGDTMKEN